MNDIHFKPISREELQEDLTLHFECQEIRNVRSDILKLLNSTVSDDKDISRFCDIKGCNNEVILPKKLGKNVKKILCPYHFQLKKHSKRKKIGLKYHNLKKELKTFRSRSQSRLSPGLAPRSKSPMRLTSDCIVNTKTDEIVKSRSAWTNPINNTSEIEKKYGQLTYICKSFCNDKITSEQAKKDLCIFFSKN